MVSFKMAQREKTQTSTPFSQIKEMRCFAVLQVLQMSVFLPHFYYVLQKFRYQKKKRISQVFLDKSSWSHLKKKNSVCNHGVFTPVFAPKKFPGTVKFVPLPVGGDTGLGGEESVCFVGICVAQGSWQWYETNPNFMHYC